MIFNYFKENGFEAVEKEYLKASRGEKSSIFQFPKEDIHALTNGKSGKTAALHGLSIFRALSDVVSQNKLKSNPQILDYGCGWGRITRLLATLSSDDNIYGVDVNSLLISSANDCAETLAFGEIESMGTLPFANDNFDLIFDRVWYDFKAPGLLFSLAGTVNPWVRTFLRRMNKYIQKYLQNP